MCLSLFQHAVSKYFLKNILIVMFSPLLSAVAPLLLSSEGKSSVQKVLRVQSCKYINNCFSSKCHLCLMILYRRRWCYPALPITEPPLYCAAPTRLDETNQICFIICELEGIFLLSPCSAGAAKCPCLGRGCRWRTFLFDVETNTLIIFATFLMCTRWMTPPPYILGK